ncbi:MAG TPA: type VI secretion system ATPase TssH [Polyangia bacterium]|nr:type VI secretion system ATPase TssH [Polyangia bacterium]
MSEISRVALFGKLNALGYSSIESATTFCKLRGNPYVELVHWFHQILQQQDSDLHRIIGAFQIDPGRLAKNMTEALDRLPRGATSISDFSAQIEEAIERGWVYGSLLFGDTQVRTGYLMVGAVKTPTLRNALIAMSREFEKLRGDRLTDEFAALTNGSPEAGARPAAGGAASDGAGSGGMAPAAMGKGEALAKFSVDLTERARKKEIDPISGRNDEIRQIIDILMRRRQNNPILTGEAGVGKTAVVEGFALRIAAGDVPPPLKDVTLRALDVGLLQAGASMKGEFESRLRQVIDEVQSSPKPIILFIDEAHTLVGAGGAAGTGDAANLLKPALARGKLRTIAATTWAEYKKHIEKDPALTRRFQVVQIPEPEEDKALVMMRGMASTLEAHHGVPILDEALEAAVTLSHRYIPARQLPDKAVSLLDTACARVAISQSAVPAELDDCRSRIAALEVEQDIIAREKAGGWDIADRENATRAKLEAEKTRLAALEARWKVEKDLVAKVSEIRRGGRGSTESDKLKAIEHELHQIQGESPLIFPTVDKQAVAAVVGDWTGIPVGRMVKDEIQSVLKLADTLSQRVIGQRHALDMIARRIQTSRASLSDTRKPIGVFLLAGPSGVGKTETALTLAEALYGGEQNLITINMSEFQEAHTVSTLKGAPPGYVGYGEGGVLTEAVRRRPYSVVLLDEVEKAHPDVHEIFFQVFDKGVMEDGEGRLIDFKNTLILLTSNVGSDLIINMCKDPELKPEPEGIAAALRAPLLKVFPAALLGRLVTIPYYPLSDEMVGAIVRLQLGRVAKRVKDAHGVPFEYDDAVVKLIVSRCTELESGGRMIDAILTNTLLPRISQEILGRLGEGRPVGRVAVSAEADDFTYKFD